MEKRHLKDRRTCNHCDEGWVGIMNGSVEFHPCHWCQDYPTITSQRKQHKVPFGTGLPRKRKEDRRCDW